MINYRVANELLQIWKKEKIEQLDTEQKNLEELKTLKAKAEADHADYERSMLEKKQGFEKISHEFKDYQERADKVEHLLSKMVLNLERLANLIIPDRAPQMKKVTKDNAERVLTLCGLTLEQKATILAYRNRSFPIESINDDTTVGTRPSYLKGQAQAEKGKEEPAGGAIKKDEYKETDEENFVKELREKIQCPKSEADGKKNI